jgi:hypothetical protein
MQQTQLSPQGFDLGQVLGDVVRTAIPIVLSTLSASPQMKPQSAGPLSPQFSIGGGLTVNPFNASPQGAQLSPQGFDLGQVLSDVVRTAIPIVLSALSASPQVKPQSAGPLSPQFSIGGGLTFNPFNASPQAAQLSPQGLDFSQVLGDVVRTALPIVLSTLSASPQMGGATRVQ